MQEALCVLAHLWSCSPCAYALGDKTPQAKPVRKHGAHVILTDCMEGGSCIVHRMCHTLER